jgi:hypothetical protein
MVLANGVPAVISLLSAVLWLAAPAAVEDFCGEGRSVADNFL